MKKIPKKYCFSPRMENGGRYRYPSEIGKEIRNTPLDEIMCPNCGAKLIIINYSDSVCDKYVVGCTECDWELPYGEISDYGEAKCQFDTWLEAFYLLGKPKEFINENLSLLFYPEILTDEYNSNPCPNAPHCYDKNCECNGDHDKMIKCGMAFSEKVKDAFVEKFSVKGKNKKEIRFIEYNYFIDAFNELVSSDIKNEIFTKQGIDKVKFLAKNLSFPVKDLEKELSLINRKD